MRIACSRHAASVLLASAISFSGRLDSHAVEVSQRTEEEILARALYSPPPETASYAQQLSDAITIKSMRGKWRFTEYYNSGATFSGALTFRGSPSTPEKGKVQYEGSAAAGRGPWILKADGFGRNPNGKGASIEQKALWKLRRSDGGGTYTYEGRVKVPPYSGDQPTRALVEGPIVELINGGKPKGGSERKVGRFEAELTRLLTADEEDAAIDGFAAGGAPEAMRVVCVQTTAMRCQ